MNKKIKEEDFEGINIYACQLKVLVKTTNKYFAKTINIDDCIGSLIYSNVELANKILNEDSFIFDNAIIKIREAVVNNEANEK